MSPIETYDGASVVFTFGGFSVGVWVCFVLAVALFVGFLARVVQHENRAYAAMAAHEPVEAGPPVEAEPAT
ncbi:hypothetical protein [Pseudonocardia oroxyli]|uniref:Heme exporter protein D n=1 Tax=Pseudonocardia oroxyli TaxID=366584 RepID=A0A1G8DEU5_PSEOR|nr:hypothetical protein [Pseudonocardia oroxyli]SDH55969.1 hypothetical protein SAMN05216377_12616 [Pseudonocardia oroxyli]